MRILMLLSKPTQQDGRVQKEAASLRDAGHEVHVLQWGRQDPEAPAKEMVAGIQVHRILASLRGGSPRDTVAWWRAAARAGADLHAERRFDAVHAHDLDTLPAGVRLKRRLGLPLVFDAHEHFADMIRHDHPRLVSLAAEAIERRSLRHVDAIISVNDALVTHYRRVARPQVPVVQVMNTPNAPATADPAGPFTVCYIGTLDRGRLFPDAVAALGDAGIPFIVGGKREGVYHDVAALAKQYSHVTFLGPVPFPEVMPRTQQSHAVMCMLDPEHGQNRWITATKIYDAMAAGRPSIVADGSPTADVVRKHDCGLVVPYGVNGLVSAAERLRDDPGLARELGRNGRRAAMANYTWEVQGRRLVELYTAL